MAENLEDQLQEEAIFYSIKARRGKIFDLIQPTNLFESIQPNFSFLGRRNGNSRWLQYDLNPSEQNALEILYRASHVFSPHCTASDAAEGLVFFGIEVSIQVNKYFRVARRINNIF